MTVRTANGELLILGAEPGRSIIGITVADTSGAEDEGRLVAVVLAPGESRRPEIASLPVLRFQAGQVGTLDLNTFVQDDDPDSSLVWTATVGSELAPLILFETHLSRYSAGHDMAAVLRALFASNYAVRYLSSSYERGTRLINGRGYHGSAPIPTDGVERVIFENIADDDAVDFICHTGGARTVLLAPRHG